MDQLKEQLEKVKPYTFWIVCVVILLMSLGTWYTATGTLHQQKEENQSKINSANTTLSGLSAKAKDHPNKATEAGMDQLIRAYGLEVAAGWEAQYKRQVDVLVWPATFDKDFQEAVKDKRPIEKVPVATPVSMAIPDGLRRRYRDFIADELPSLAETIGATWYVQNGAQPELGGPQPQLGPSGQLEEVVDKSLVLWNPANQAEILTGHYPFTAMEDDPSTLDILYAQEDLWVFQNLMEIIKKTNDGAEARHDAAVKQIEFIRIGKTALGQAGQVMLVGAPAAGAPGGPGAIEGYGQPQGPTAGAQQPTSGENPDPGGQTPGVPTSPTTDPAFNPKDPANWRYVDQNNFPLAGFQLRAALNPQSTPEERMKYALLTVAKRMPVRLRLEMSQGKLNKLLAECGNAALPVEIRQVRINREPAPVGSLEGFFAAGAGAAPGAGVGPGEGVGPGAGAYRGGGEGFPAPGGLRGGYPGGGEGFGGPSFQPGVAPGAGSLTRDATVDTTLIKVELYGIVYLYNPVNQSLLGLAPAGAPTAMTVPSVNGTGG